MKFGNVTKSAGEASAVTADVFAKINQFTRKALTAEEVFIFPVVMCDNEVDRDLEKFSVTALNELAGHFLGKTVICDHNRKNANQMGRIFSTEVIHVPSVKTFDGEDLYQLTAQVYMLKTEDNASAIQNIEAGIYKEVSVGCTVSSEICSVCGKEYYGDECQHLRGKEYNGKKCFLTLSKATDAYELSFVAVPAQPGAGVVKWYSGNEKDKKGLIKTMNYDETKKSLAKLGVDLDEIATENGIVPEMSVILDTVKAKHDEEIAFIRAKKITGISAESIKNAIGKEMTEDEVYGVLKSADENASKAKLYEEIKSKAVDEAIKSGVKAKGEGFDEERYKKIFESFSVDEINAQASDWNDEAKRALGSGRKSEEDNTEKSAYALNLADYKL